MDEAKAINVGERSLSFLAKELGKNRFLKETFYLEEILKKMGGKFIEVKAENWSDGNFNFIEVRSASDFTISYCPEFGLEMKRIQVLQAFIHYTVHALRGQKPCYVRAMSKGEVAREGLVIALCLLIPDNIIQSLLQDNLSALEISRLFRVPQTILEARVVILNKHREIGVSNG